MQSRKGNQFFEKFRILNSQEYNEEIIIQSSSDSSDYENVRKDYIQTSAQKISKRKRKCHRKVPKNISNLDITISNASAEVKKVIKREKSPVLCASKPSVQQSQSTILRPQKTYKTQTNIVKLEPSSPILTCSNRNLSTALDNDLKSPILTMKYASPKSTKRIKKMLFDLHDIENKDTVFDIDNLVLTVEENQNKLVIDNNNGRKTKEIVQPEITSSSIIKEKTYNSYIDYTSQEPNKTEIKQELLSQELCNESRNVAIAKKIQSFFDNNFGSETASQHSISDIITQKSSSRSSEDLEILTLLSQSLSNKQNITKEIKQENLTSPSSLDSSDNIEKLRKIKYKKDGLAYRLNILLKKQSSVISLWQHERFLAENSNFLIPKSECVIFRVQTVDFTYGCYFIDAVNVDSEQFCILIHNSCVFHDNIIPNVVLKIYVPYRIVDYRNCKLLLNVCKFECVTIKK